MHLKLISFAVCPYVQRAVILLKEKSAQHETTYIDLRDKPEWFSKISPRGKVPVLVADETPIFESQAICEFLDETSPPPRLLSEDPYERARDRGWFQFAEDVFAPVYRLLYASEQKVFDDASAALERPLRRLNEEMEGREFLSGDGKRFGMADVAMAPAFTKIELMRELGGYDVPSDLVNVRAWKDRLLSRDSVTHSVPEDYREASLAGMRRKGALLVAKLAS